MTNQTVVKAKVLTQIAILKGDGGGKAVLRLTNGKNVEHYAVEQKELKKLGELFLAKAQEV